MTIAGANLIGGLWIAWTAYWLVASRTAKQDRRQESALSRALHIVPLVIAGVLGERFLPDAPATFWTGFAIVVLGLGFTVWARVVLGRNFSGIVTVNHDHALITTGPYRWARNEIYTGLLIAFAGSAIARGEWRGLLALAIAFAALWRKLKLEEQWMVETFGDAYLRYRAEVRALIPFVL